jgi:hypothetical protein
MSKALRFLKSALNMRTTMCRPGDTTWRWVIYIDF